MSDSNGHNPATGDGAYPYEMADLQLDPMLREFAGELRGALLVAPPPERAEAQLAAILAEVRTMPAAEATTRPARRRRAPLLRLAAVAAAGLVALTGGLAVAGVRPPEPVSDLLESLGVDVPGSDAGEGSAPAAAPAGERARPDAESEGSNGAGASAASAPDGSAGSAQGAQGSPGDRRGNAHANGNGDANGNAGNQAAAGQAHGNGAEASAEGQETAAEAQSGETPPSEPGNSENAHSQGGGASQAAPPTHSQGTPPSEPQADAPGQSGTSGNPHGAPPGAGVSAQAQQTGAAHANDNASSDASAD